MPPLSITTGAAQADSLTFKLNQKKLLILTYMNFNEQGVSQRPVTDHNKLTYNNTKSVVVSTVLIKDKYKPYETIINNNE